MNGRGGTALGSGYLACRVCGVASVPCYVAGVPHCPRCQTPLAPRKTDSVSRTWALLLAAYILYIPANVLTMMETGSLISYRKDTIVSGVAYLWQTGSWVIAVVVFVASVTIPLLKLISLTLLLVSVQRRSVWRPRERTRLYRLLEVVGRWSMLDVYVVTILAALVQIQPVAVVKAGPAAVAFGAVVVLTTWATLSFDPRLIWDPITKEQYFHD